MTRDQFLETLHDGLAGLSPRERDDIMADYAQYFDEARAAGRSDAEVAAALGDPARLARELKAESGLRRWEDHHSPGNLIAALIALGALAAVDVMILLPIVLVLGILILVFSIVLAALGIAGIAVLFSALKAAAAFSLVSLVVRALAGAGLIALSLGCGALLLIAANGAVTLIARYARLHYRLLTPARSGMP
jgi:uncharacterized membrane protein